MFLYSLSTLRVVRPGGGYATPDCLGVLFLRAAGSRLGFSQSACFVVRGWTAAASFAGAGIAVILVVAHHGVEDVDSSADEGSGRNEC